MTTTDKKHDVSFEASGLLDACSLLRHQVANLKRGVDKSSHLMAKFWAKFRAKGKIECRTGVPGGLPPG